MTDRPKNPVHVLLVDDHPAVRESLALFLEGEGIAVCAQAGARAEALRYVETNVLDLALVDVRSPAEFNGEVTARNREDGKVLWKKSLPGLGTTPLRILRDALVVTTKTGESHFLDPASGESVGPEFEEEEQAPPAVPDELGEDVIVKSGHTMQLTPHSPTGAEFTEWTLRPALSPRAGP